MTFLVERLAELRRHLDHLVEIRPKVKTARDLQRDLSLHNDVLFSLLSVCQLVIDIAGELSAQRGLSFEDYTQAVRNLANFEEFSPVDITHLEKLPGFRNVVIHDYVQLDFARVLEALEGLEPIESFANAVHKLEAKSGDSDQS